MTLYPTDPDILHEQQKEAICASEDDAIVRETIRINNMNTLREALEKLEEAKEMLSKALSFELDKRSLLSGKCAIQINNEREFKLLMEHYESKGWLNCEGHTDKTSYYHEESVIEVTYNDGYSYMCKDSVHGSHSELGYKVITFADFADELGIKAPVFVMTSEDGVTLYEGDSWWCATNEDQDHKGKWVMWNPRHAYQLDQRSVCIAIPDKYKAFSTREAAESWILEQNRPKTIRIGNTSSYPIDVTYDGALILCMNGNNHLDNIQISVSEIFGMYEALRELKGGGKL